MNSGSSLFDTLHSVFGFGEFRPNQEEIVRAILEGRDVFAVMPTGGGKSLCYQLPAVMLEGTCMVVSPLIALMKDQVDGARANGIRAAYLNSSLPPQEQSAVIAELRSGALDLLYVAPERFSQEQFRGLLNGVKLSLAVIDEAHCISEWGHDFRPDYLSLSALVELFPAVPVAAFTATATHRVQDDILKRLSLRNPLVVRASFNRPNLTYEVRFKDRPNEQLTDIVGEHPKQAGIIYRTSRKSVNDTAAMLQSRGFRALPYHAGLTDEERKHNQEAFIRDEADVIVATIAFGMGIDKSNIRYVVHADLPRSLENYYQETGRAGRDGEPSECIMLFSQGDIPKVRFFIDTIIDEGERQRALDALSRVASFASTTVCRRRTLLEYFGETLPDENCGSCDVCLGKRETVDCSTEAQMLLSAIARTDQRFGATHIIDIVTGSRNRKLLESGHDQIKTYGVGKGKSKTFWRQVVDELLAQKIIAKAEGLYPTLYLLPRALEVLKGETSVTMLRLKERTGKKNAPAAHDGAYDRTLFEQLRTLRKELADRENVPPYIIFSDRSLRDMATIFPEDEESMLTVSGVGKVKLERYGEVFLDMIRTYTRLDGGTEKNSKETD
ncbi:DNA helicase RecQ [Prosthecochloris sp. N3]|uniref:DNA helicase RecQ n=1 Tax=Prosthecochloris ethylica TaxID=2743976 RepID=A0ABR9XSS4_9CHLB|nr:DNA helicase RecQ [Prosthecochloris ethylica]MBF0585970.1 DNA helicase RecQ [Prosthecochloris ethylica]MBF0637025.1 DNA helicase RecQ [Prosthecochloris ethylica]NUK47262.1 DNA helicase RecQ [Prosthecochloris ethylica]